MEFVPAGTSAQASGGEISLPLHVYFVGILPAGFERRARQLDPGRRVGRGLHGLVAASPAAGDEEQEADHPAARHRPSVLPRVG